MKERRSMRGAFAAMLGISIAGGSLFMACVPEAAVTDIVCPPREDFPKVSPLLERRCGTLDCHGQVSRPLRIYGQYGLRLQSDPDNPDPELVSGNLNDPTTADELEANYQAVCGLEPEKMGAVQDGDAEPESLTIVRKPRLQEKHKGGRIWNQGKPPDRCLVTWIQGDYEHGKMDGADCTAALQE